MYLGRIPMGSHPLGVQPNEPMYDQRFDTSHKEYYAPKRKVIRHVCSTKMPKLKIKMYHYHNNNNEKKIQRAREKD